MKENRDIKTARRINHAKAQIAEYNAILKSDRVKAWPDFAKEPYREKVKALHAEVRKLEGRQAFVKSLKVKKEG